MISGSKKIFRSKLSAVLLTKILLISGLFTLIITAMQLYSDYRDEIQSLHQQLLTIEKTQKASISTSLWDFNEPLIQLQLQGIIDIDGLVFAKLITGFGKVYSAGKDSEHEKITKIITLNYVGNDIASLIIVADKQFVKNKIKDKFYLVLLSQAVKTFFVSLFILIFIYQAVIKHIEEILNWLNTFRADGSFTPIQLNNQKKTHNEIDDLKVSISDMGKLVHDHTKSLEKKVEQRTIEFKKRTEELENTQKELHKILWAKEQKLADVSHTINDWLWDLDQFGNIVSISDEFSQLIGLIVCKNSPQPLVKVLPFKTDESSQEVICNLQKAITEKAVIEAINCCFLSIDDDTIWVTLTGTPYFAESGEFLGYHGSATNITQQKHLEKLAYTDTLTGITNRVAFFYDAEKELSRSKRLSYAVGVMMLDLDYFKQVNDNYGHDAGDKVLIKVANKLNSCLREQDCIGRIGGEEFAVIVPGADKLGLHNLATRLQDAIQQLGFSFLHKEKKITISIGYTVVKHNETFKSALNRADKHLYSAKSNGRNCFVTDKEFVPNIVS